jgi:hypothetical protein
LKEVVSVACPSLALTPPEAQALLEQIIEGDGRVRGVDLCNLYPQARAGRVVTLEPQSQIRPAVKNNYWQAVG